MQRLLPLLLLALVSCSGIRSTAVVPIQSKDKMLTCRDILLEVSEAEQYKVAAEKNKDPGMRSFIAPLGYMYTLSSADEAIDASNQRIKYLQEVYQLSGCTAGTPAVLSPEQMRGHTFTGGYPTPVPGR